jgi:hypothetical protein
MAASACTGLRCARGPALPQPLRARIPAAPRSAPPPLVSVTSAKHGKRAAASTTAPRKAGGGGTSANAATDDMSSSATTTLGQFVRQQLDAGVKAARKSRRKALRQARLSIRSEFVASVAGLS